MRTKRTSEALAPQYWQALVVVLETTPRELTRNEAPRSLESIRSGERPVKKCLHLRLSGYKNIMVMHAQHMAWKAIRIHVEASTEDASKRACNVPACIMRCSKHS